MRTVFLYGWFIAHTPLNYNRNLPKDSTTLVGDPHQFPFFTATDMFIKKIECLAVRQKGTDEDDLMFLVDHFSLDMARIYKKVPASYRNQALENHNHHARVVEILGSLDIK